MNRFAAAVVRSRAGLCELAGFAALAAAAWIVWIPAALLVLSAMFFNWAYAPQIRKGGS
jgi:hypothetical protein